MKTFNQFNEEKFDNYYANSLITGAMIQIKSKALNAPKTKFQVMPPRNSTNEKAWADDQLQIVLGKWGNRTGADQLTDLFWKAFDKDIKNNRYL